MTKLTRKSEACAKCGQLVSELSLECPNCLNARAREENYQLTLERIRAQEQPVILVDGHAFLTLRDRKAICGFFLGRAAPAQGRGSYK